MYSSADCRRNGLELRPPALAAFVERPFLQHMAVNLWAEAERDEVLQIYALAYQSCFMSQCTDAALRTDAARHGASATRSNRQIEQRHQPRTRPTTFMRALLTAPWRVAP